MNNNNKKKLILRLLDKEKIMSAVFMMSAFVSVLAVILICLFLFANGIPAIGKIGIFEFLGGTIWQPGSGKYGILPMIIGSIYVTAGALVIGVPIGILSAVFLSRFCPKKLYPVIKSGIELLAGIPSIVYGFFGLMVVVPFIRTTLGGTGSSLLAASIILGIMILPTIITVSESAISAVPESYYEGSLALGATHERSVIRAVLPAAKSGVGAGVILGVGRAIGETMAVIMVAGNSAVIPESITQSIRTLTGNIVIDMAYAEGLHREALIATGVVLFVFILIINFCFSLLKKKARV